MNRIVLVRRMTAAIGAGVAAVVLAGCSGSASHPTTAPSPGRSASPMPSVSAVASATPSTAPTTGTRSSTGATGKAPAPAPAPAPGTATGTSTGTSTGVGAARPPAGYQKCAMQSGYTAWGAHTNTTGNAAIGYTMVYVPTTCWYDPKDDEDVTWTDAPVETSAKLSNTVTIEVYKSGQLARLTPSQLVGWKFQNTGHLALRFSSGTITAIQEIYHP